MTAAEHMILYRRKRRRLFIATDHKGFVLAITLPVKRGR